LLVYQGPLALATTFAGPDGGPKEFDLIASFTSPFPYDPSLGHLLVEIRNYSAPAGASKLVPEGSGESSDQASRVFSTNPDAVTATGVDTGADILQFVTSIAESAPKILQHPEGGTVAAGSDFFMNAVGFGTPPLYYQWFFDGTILEGETNATLNLPGLDLSSSGNYTVVVANSNGSVSSEPAVMIVLEAPSIIISPVNQSVAQGDDVLFNVEAAGGGVLSYQWQFNGVDLPGQTNTVLNLTNVNIHDTGPYAVRVANVVSEATSTPAYLTLNQGSGILVIPPAYEAQEAPANAGSFVSNYRMQTVYAAGLFPANPVLIHEIRWRPDRAADASFVIGEFHLELRLSTTLTQPESLSLVFAENSGSDEVVAHDGPIILSSASAGPTSGPKKFDISVPLTSPFAYDPTRGNLLLEIKMPQALHAPPNDATGFHGDAISRVISLDANSNQALWETPGADVLQLAYTIGPNPPVIIRQPADKVAALDGQATFVLSVSGSAPLSYQWFHNGDPIEMATGPTLALSHLNASDQGYYSVAVSNTVGGATSRMAELIVLAPPAIVESPQNVTATEGESFSLRVTASGDEPLFYQWFKNEELLPGEESSMLTVTSAGLADNGIYLVEVRNPAGRTMSNPALVTVQPNPSRMFFLQHTTGSAGDLVDMSLEMQAQGNETSLGLSLQFEISNLTFEEAVIGNAAADDRTTRS
jgi:hypothetical protein